MTLIHQARCCWFATDVHGRGSFGHRGEKERSVDIRQASSKKGKALGIAYISRARLFTQVYCHPWEEASSAD
jgi:isopentenyl phosphate kinase